MNILVTGGAGFIGSHLVERLLVDGHRVTILDDLNDFYKPELKEANLRSVQAVGLVEFHHGSICDRETVEHIMRCDRPDAVIHLAARAGVRPSLENPLLYEEVNVRGLMVILEACKKSRVSKLVFASSSSVYGATNYIPFRETDSSYLPISPYAATKLAGEHICYTYSHLYDIKVVCLRFFTVYGPRQRPDLAIRKFAASIVAGTPITVFGDGTTGRDYTYIDDTVNGIIAGLGHDCRYDVFNLGNAHPISLNEMIQTIEQALGKRAVIRRLPLQPGDVHQTYADISKAARVLGYDPRTPFSAGIQKFVEWFRQEQSSGADSTEPLTKSIALGSNA